MGTSELGRSWQVEPIAAQDRPAAVRVLARAFRDNPLNVAVIGNAPERRLRSNVHGMRATLGATFGRAHILAARPPAPEHMSDVATPLPPLPSLPTGFLLAIAPFGYPPPSPSVFAQLRCLFGQGPRTMSRWAQVYKTLEAVHPQEPHWYLGVLGVDPDFQGRGLGTALLNAFLRRVDSDSAPGYLETDRRENVRFYERVGFETVREVSVLDVPVWCMWRPQLSKRAGAVP